MLPTYAGTADFVKHEQFNYWESTGNVEGWQNF